VERWQLTLQDVISGGKNMTPRREGLIWQIVGLLVVIAAGMEIRSAAQQSTWTLDQKSVGTMDLVWPYAMGVLAGFLLLAGAAAMISGHVLGVMSGVTHRGSMWKLSGLFCCLAGIVAIVAKMTHVAMSRGVGMPSVEVGDLFHMLGNGDLAVALSGGYVFLLGIMLLMADRVGTRLRSANAAGVTPLRQTISGLGS
jgi:hypothetical protein